MSTERKGTPSIDQVRAWGSTCSIPQAGSCFDLSRSTAYEYARLGQLPGVIQIGSRRRVLVSALIAALTGDSTAA